MFILQSFLLKTFLSYNEYNSQVPGLVITDDMTKNYCEFLNLLMANIYGLFFQEILPKMFPRMKKTMHLSPNKRIGDWFLTNFEIIIRLYDFVHQPYILPAFLTIRIFSVELVRQRLTIEEEHILSFRKSSGINFPRKVGPYSVKSRATLPLVDNLLRTMGFPLVRAINYDPH